MTKFSDDQSWLGAFSSQPSNNKELSDRKIQRLIDLAGAFSKHQSWQSADRRQPPIENSLLFRSLVQIMVCLSILVTGIITNNYHSFLLIVLAIAAGCWSWFVRYHRSYWLIRLVTTCYLIVVPAAFLNLGKFDSFLSSIAMLLLAMNPACWITRQNLSFAMLLSWITAGLITTVNVNPLTISLMLLLSIVSLPTMWLEYRSRIELPPLTWSWQVKQLQVIPWQHLAKIASIALGAGLVMALLLFLVPKPNLAQVATKLDYSWLDKLPKSSSPVVDKVEGIPSQTPSIKESGQTTATTPSIEQSGQTISNTPEFGKIRQTAANNQSIEQSGQTTATTPPIGQSGQTPLTTLSINQQAIPIAPSPPVAEQLDQAVHSPNSHPAENVQLSPQTLAQLQVQTSDMIDYQRLATGKAGKGSVSDRVQDLAEFLQTHAQLSSTPSKSADSLLNNCSSPQNCQMQGSAAELKQAFEEMAASTITEAKSAIDQNPTKIPNMEVKKTPTGIDRVNGLQVIMLFLVGGIALGCGFLWLSYDRKIQSYNRRVAQLPALEQIYRQLLKQLVQQGLPAKRLPQSPMEYAALVNNRLSPPTAQIVSRISQTYVAWRYGHKTANIDLMQRLLQELITNYASAGKSSV